MQFKCKNAGWNWLHLNKTIKYHGRDAILCGLNDDGALVLRSDDI